MSRIHKFQSNQSVMWPRAEETVGNRGKVVTWKRTDRVDAINPVFVKVVLPLGLRQISRHIEVLPGGPRQETLTNQSVSERVSCSLIHSHFKTLIIIFQCRVHFRPIHMQLESPSVLAWCLRVRAVKKICLAHDAGKTIAVGLRISPIPVLSYSEPLIEF